jgi:hypothetical protein
MVINRKDIVADRDKYDSNKYFINSDFNNFCLAINYSRYKNNFNIIRKYIRFEDINLKDNNLKWLPLYCSARESK